MRPLVKLSPFVSMVVVAAFAAAPALAQGGTTEGWLTTSDGARIHYLEMGTGVPVVLIHGGGGSAQSNWFETGIGQRLAKNHHVVALDCRGHGESDDYPKRAPAAGAPASDGMAAARNWPVLDVIELMDHLGIAKAHIHGYSWGGTITEQLLATHPERFITAALGGWGIPEIDPEMKAKIPPDKVGTDPLEAEAIARFRERVAARKARYGGGAAAPQGGETKGSDGGPARTTSKIDLTTIKIPVLAINGEFDQPNAKTARMARELANFRSVVVPGKTHMTAVPTSQYTEALVEFINANDPKQ